MFRKWFGVFFLLFILLAFQMNVLPEDTSRCTDTHDEGQVLLHVLSFLTSSQARPHQTAGKR